MQLYRTCNLARAVHACTLRPSTFRPCTTSGVLFTRYMLRPYRPIPSYIAGMLDRHCMEEDFCFTFIHCQTQFHHLGPLLQKATDFTIGSFDFRFRSRGAYERYAFFSAYDISYLDVTLTFHLVLVDATMDYGPRECINFVDLISENIKTFAFIKYAIVASLSTHLGFCFFATTVPLVMVGGRITSSQTVAEIVRPRFENSSATVPSQILTLTTQIFANVLSVYANHLSSVSLLRIRSSITLSMCPSCNLKAERCFTCMFTRQTHISFQNISWCLTLA